MPTPVQSASGSATSGTTVTVALTATGSGHSLIVYVGAGQDTTVPTVSKITVNGASNTDNFTACASNINNAECNSFIWYDPNCAAGITTVEVQFNAGTGGEQANAVWVEEWPVLLTLDKHPAGTGNSAGTTSFASGSTGTLSAADEIIGGTVCAEGESSLPTITGPGGGWTNHAQISLASITGMIAGWQAVTATTAQTYSGTLSQSSVYGACIASFTYATAAAAAAPPYSPAPSRAPVQGRGFRGGQAGTTPVQVPAPPQRPAPPRNPAPSRALVQGRAVPGITGTAPRQLYQALPRRILARAVVLFTPVRTVNQLPPPRTSGTLQPLPAMTPPRRILARAVVLFTPVRTVNASPPAGGLTLVQGARHVISAYAATINQGSVHVISPRTQTLIQEWDQ